MCTSGKCDFIMRATFFVFKKIQWNAVVERVVRKKHCRFKHSGAVSGFGWPGPAEVQICALARSSLAHAAFFSFLYRLMSLVTLPEEKGHQ